MFAECTAGPAAAHDYAQHNTLYGVSIGENAAYALANLGLKPPRWQAAPKDQPQPVVEYREALADYGNALLYLWFTTRIESIAVAAYDSHKPNIADPYGIHIGDSLTRLLQKRGQPDRVTDGKYVYGPVGALHWAYTIHGDRIAKIAVSNGTI